MIDFAVFSGLENREAEVLSVDSAITFQRIPDLIDSAIRALNVCEDQNAQELVNYVRNGSFFGDEIIERVYEAFISYASPDNTWNYEMIASGLQTAMAMKMNGFK